MVSLTATCISPARTLTSSPTSPHQTTWKSASRSPRPTRSGKLQPSPSPEHNLTSAQWQHSQLPHWGSHNSCCCWPTFLAHQNSWPLALQLLRKVYSPPASYHPASTRYYGCLQPVSHRSWELDYLWPMEMNNIQTLQLVLIFIEQNFDCTGLFHILTVV